MFGAVFEDDVTVEDTRESILPPLVVVLLPLPKIELTPSKISLGSCDPVEVMEPLALVLADIVVLPVSVLVVMVASCPEFVGPVCVLLIVLLSA